MANPVRLPTRKIYVSTAMTGSPNAVFSTTLAVFLPTPAKASNSSRVRGTWPLCLVMRSWQVLMTLAALELYSPIELI